MTFLSYDQPEGYHSVDTDTPGPSTTSRRKEESAPAPYDSRRGGEGVQAIMVDDGEVGEMESDSESDAEERILNGGRANTHSNGTSSKARVKRTKLDATVVDSDDSEYGQALKQILASNDLSDAEEGEIVEVFPDGASRARNLSVSEDDVPSGTGTLDGESRYALGRGKAKGKAKASLLGGNGKRKADNGGALAKPASSSGSDSDDSSDDSIVAIDPPKDYKAKPTPESKSKAKAKAKASDRKAFWNAKGVVAQVISSDED
jgi:hypothetical protein